MLTRAVEEARLVRARLKLLEEIGVSTASDGSNPFVGDAIEDALLRLGFAVMTPGSVSDGDLAAVTAARLPHLRALARVLLDEAILGNVTAFVSEQDGPSMAQYSDMARSLRLSIADQWSEIELRFNSANGRVASGTPPCGIPDALSGWRRHGRL